MWRDNGEGTVSPGERLYNTQQHRLTDSSLKSLASYVQPEVALDQRSDVFLLF